MLDILSFVWRDSEFILAFMVVLHGVQAFSRYYWLNALMREVSCHFGITQQMIFALI